MTIWKTGYPPKNGQYLVTVRYYINDVVYNKIQLVKYANNLSKVDKYDFDFNTNPGWYDYDSEYGYYPVGNVVAWMELPEAYKEGEE